MPDKKVHTVPNPSGGGWVNQVEGRIVSRHRTKDNAVRKGRDIARDNEFQHTVHGRDGAIHKTNTCDSYPNPVRKDSKNRGGTFHRNEKTGAFTVEKSVRSIYKNSVKYADVLKRLATK